MPFDHEVNSIELAVLEGTFAVCRLAPDVEIPPWVPTIWFVSATRTADELTIVCPSEAVPDSVKMEGDFDVLKIEGHLDFSLTGILLADAGIPIFTLSSYDTDYVMVKWRELNKAVAILSAAVHTVG